MLPCWWGVLFAVVVRWVVGLVRWWLNGNGGFMGFAIVCVGLSVDLVGLLGGLVVAP